MYRGNRLIAVVLFVCLASGLFFSFRLPILKSDATVDQQQGLYIFMFSKPRSNYEYLGSVKKALAWTGQPDEMLNSMIKKVKKEYPGADGILFTSLNMDKADAIKIKTK